MWLHRLADADASCGGKAVGLARLIAAGLPVPEGFVIDDGAFRQVVGDLDPASDGIGHALAEAAQRIATTELPAELVRDVEARTASLGLVAVRSSATIEDGNAGAAAGVFSSRTAVPPDELWAAIRAVWTSALTPLAVTYARRRSGRMAIGVIIQRFVPGVVATIYTRTPGHPTSREMLIQRGAELHVIARDTAADQVTPPDLEELRTLALRAEAAIDASTGADLEIVLPPAAGGQLVQARPMIHRAPVARRSPPPTVIAPLVADGRRWTWDVTHNPDPLSPAQAGLVERVERAGHAPWSLRVCAGFLYAAPRDGVSTAAIDPPTTTAELAARVVALEAAMATALDGSGAPASGSLGDAIARYVAFHAVWATQLSPLIAATRARLMPDHLVGARPSAVEATLLAAARDELDASTVLERLGVLSPAWDVSVPTFAERPELVHAAIERARVIVRAPAVPRDPVPSEHELARAAADLAERDDLWFARAQWLVRRAILERARQLAIDPGDACWIPLDELEHATTLDAEDVHRRASGARNAAARAAAWMMPLVVGGGAEDEPLAHRALTGVGTGPRVTGRVVRFDSLATVIAVTASDVVVTRAVTPALAVLVIGCAALISETGGLLDHGAALARELGIPCVVGCGGAWTLADGMVVTVDGDAGAVEVRAS